MLGLQAVASLVLDERTTLLGFVRKLTMTRNSRIIVADDDPDVRAYYSKVLTVLGYEVVGLVENGLALVEQCRELRPDLVIADIRMPEMDGLEAAEIIYSETPIPIIVVSGYHDPELVERAQQGYISTYLLKPTTPHELRVAIALATKRFAQSQAPQPEQTEPKQEKSQPE
jgi:two-component system, response regulator PdtaR